MRLIDALMEPTALYVKPVLSLLASHGEAIHGMAHVTGGGLTENLPRVLPEGVGAEVDLDSWQAPSVFRWLADAGDVPEREMLKTFNCGVGMILVVAPDRAKALTELLRAEGETVRTIGEVGGGHGVGYTGTLW